MSHLPPELVAYIPFAVAALVVIIGLVAYCLWTRPSVHVEGPPRTAEQIAENDDTIRIPQGHTYAGHDLTMRLQLRPVHSHEATVPVAIREDER